MKLIRNPKPGLKELQQRSKKLSTLIAKLEKLVGQKVTAFGPKSYGIWGSHTQERVFEIRDVGSDEIGDGDYHSLNIYLKDYDADEYGLIYTDPTFLESLRHLLKKVRIKADIDYSEQGAQGSDFVNLDVRFH